VLALLEREVNPEIMLLNCPIRPCVATNLFSASIIVGDKASSPDEAQL